jgi:hypothetical protein
MEDIFLYWPMRFGGPAGDGLLPGQVVVIGQYIPIPQGDIQSSHQGFARQGLQKFGLLILEELPYGCMRHIQENVCEGTSAELSFADRTV